MSAEIVHFGDRIFVIVGDPDVGYDVLYVDPRPINSFRHKYEARRAINNDEMPVTWEWPS